MKYVEITCSRCNRPILKDDKRIELDEEVFHEYCKNVEKLKS